MTKNIIAISYDLMTLETEVTEFAGIPMGVPAGSLPIIYPFQFWIENDTEGNPHLCTTAIEGKTFPKLVTDTTTFHAREFVTVDILKQDGDRNWRPSTKPPRPIILP